MGWQVVPKVEHVLQVKPGESLKSILPQNPSDESEEQAMYGMQVS